MKNILTTLIVSLGLIVSSNVFANSVINATATATPNYVFSVDNYAPCKDGTSPVKDAFGKEAVSTMPAMKSCVNGSCSLKFNLGQSSSVEYYESDGAGCIKKIANESTPGFKKTFLARVSFAASLFPSLFDDPTYPEDTAQHGVIAGRGKSGDNAYINVSYANLPKSDQIIWDDKIINVTFQ